MDKVLVGIPDDLQVEAARLLDYLKDCDDWRSVDNMHHHLTYALVAAGYCEYRLEKEKCFIRAKTVRQRIRPFGS